MWIFNLEYFRYLINLWTWISIILLQLWRLVTVVSVCLFWSITLCLYSRIPNLLKNINVIKLSSKILFFFIWKELCAFVFFFTSTLQTAVNSTFFLCLFLLFPLVPPLTHLRWSVSHITCFFFATWAQSAPKKHGMLFSPVDFVTPRTSLELAVRTMKAVLCVAKPGAWNNNKTNKQKNPSPFSVKAVYLVESTVL